jgi:hypothetical protein
MSWLEWYWPAALAFTALIVFGIPEYIGLKYGGHMFSHFMQRVGNYPFWGKLWIMAWGLLIGALFVHFNGWCLEGPRTTVLNETTGEMRCLLFDPSCVQNARIRWK